MREQNKIEDVVIESVKFENVASLDYAHQNEKVGDRAVIEEQKNKILLSYHLSLLELFFGKFLIKYIL